MRKIIILTVMVLAIATAFCGCGAPNEQSMDEAVGHHVDALITQNADGQIDKKIYKRYLKAANEELNEIGVKSDEEFASLVLSYLNQGSSDDFHVTGVRKDANGNYIVDMVLSRTSFLSDYKKLKKDHKDTNEMKAMLLRGQKYGTLKLVHLTFLADDDMRGFSDKSIKKMIDVMVKEDPHSIN